MPLLASVSGQRHLLCGNIGDGSDASDDDITDSDIIENNRREREPEVSSCARRTRMGTEVDNSIKLWRIY